MSFLTGKRAKNKAYQWLQSSFGPLAQQQGQMGQQFLGAYQGALGLGDDEQFNTGFDRFKRSSGYQNVLNETMRGVTGSMAARGLLASGSTLRALQDRSSQLAQQTYGNYLGQVLGGAQTAFGASQGYANTIAGAGQVGGTQGALSGIGALGQGIGGFASVFRSDRRLKDDIKQVGTRADGLGIYEYTMRHTGERQIGVMADEVAQLRPEALGPVVEGYATVRYDLL
jgi:hypothetical protein